ncbi:MAG: FxsA family protein [Acidimicrobiales bacterium]
MFAVLALLFLLVPLIELAVIIQVGGAIGVLNTIGLLVAISVVGGWLVRREGMGVLRRIQRSLDRHELPHREVVDGGLILLAGALLLTPGFLTDVFGVLLLLPPTRAVVRGAVLHRLRRRATLVTMVGSGPFPGYYDTTARDHE